jgi:hypothetical protein
LGKQLRNAPLFSNNAIIARIYSQSTVNTWQSTALIQIYSSFSCNVGHVSSKDITPTMADTSTPSKLVGNGGPPPAAAPAAASPPGASLSLEDLQRRVALLEQDLRREERSKHYVQLERDRVCEFWEVTKRKLAAAETALQKASLELEAKEEAHAVDIKVLRQRIVALMAAHAAREATIVSEAQDELRRRVSASECVAAESLREHHAALSAAHADRQAALEAADKYRAECERDKMETRVRFESSLQERCTSFESRLASAVQSAEERCANEVHAAEVQRELAVKQLLMRHENDVRDLREQYVATIRSQAEALANLQPDWATPKITRIET